MIFRNQTDDNPDRDGYGLTLDVYRHARQDCTLGGVTSTANQLTLVGTVDYRTDKVSPVTVALPRMSRVFAPSDKAPPVWLVLGRHSASDAYIMPGDPQTGLPVTDWCMSGGNYAATTDSRFWEVRGGHGHGAPRVHDRIER